MSAATEVYIDRVDGASCCDTQIRLFKGSNDAHSSYLQECRPQLLTFLNGSNKDKKQLQIINPTQFNYFSEIWKVRNDNMVQSVAEKYVFLLVPCYKKECIHPVCKKGKPPVEIVWYKNGPPISVLPLPVPDKSRPWGGKCAKCTDFCTGHFLPPQQCFEYILKIGTKDCVPPPSVVLKKAFEDANKEDKNLDEMAPQLAKRPCFQLVKLRYGFSTCS